MIFGPPIVTATGFAQVAVYPAGSAFGPRQLGDFEFVWVLRGRGQWTTDQLSESDTNGTRSITITPGQLILARRGSTDSYQWDQEIWSKHAFVHFTIFEESRLPSLEQWPSSRPMPQSGALSGLCSYLLELAAMGSDEALRRTNDVLQLLMDIFVSGPLPTDAAEGSSSRLSGLFDRVRGEWESGGYRIISISELSSYATVSAGHLSRLFRENFEVGPATALEAARLVVAATALQRTDLPIREVAEWAGFSSPYHFSHRFSHLYSVPPGQYRRATNRTDPLEPMRGSRILLAVRSLLPDGDGPSPPGWSGFRLGGQ